MAKEGYSILEIRVRPSAVKTKICEFKSALTVIDIAAPPHKGRANQELLSYLARVFDVPKSELEIVRGETSKHKWIKVPLAEDELWRKLKDAR